MKHILHIITTAILFAVGTLNAQTVKWDATFISNLGETYHQSTVVENDGTTKTQTTFYYDAKTKKVINEEIVVFTEQPLELISFKKIDNRTGREETIKRNGKNFALTYKKESTESMEVEEVEKEEEDVVIPALLQYYLADHFAALEKNEALEFHLIANERLDKFTFTAENQGKEERQGTNCMKVKVEVDSWVIAQILDPLYFYVETKAPHRLLEFNGRLLISDNEGNPIDGQVKFSYQ